MVANLNFFNPYLCVLQNLLYLKEVSQHIFKQLMHITIVKIHSNKKQSSDTGIQINLSSLTEFNKSSILTYLRRSNIIDGSTINLKTVKSDRKFLIDKQLDDNIVLQQSCLPLNLVTVIQNPQYTPKSDKKITKQDFEIIAKIGQGSYAQIFLAQHKYDRKLYCMKRVNKDSCITKSGGVSHILNQEKIMRACNSKWIINLYFSFEDSYFVYYIMEFCPYGDLNQLIFFNSDMCNQDKIIYYSQVVLAISYLHARNIVYRDIKPQNILIDVNGSVKLCDFGFAVELQTGKKLNDICGSYQYLAPEVINKQPYDKAVDLYCLGVLLYEIMSGSNPFKGITPENITQMKQRQITFDNKKFSPACKLLIQKLMNVDSKKRSGYQKTHQIFLDPFFRENEKIVIKAISGQVVTPSKFKLRILEISGHTQLMSRPIVLNSDYNYLDPGFDVNEKYGPKFSSNY